MKEAVVRVLAESPLLLLFLVAAVGYPLGKVRMGRVRLGVAMVLFVGLVFGAVDQRLRLPEVVSQIGLVLFVYTVGLASGPGFFATFRSQGGKIGALAVLGPLAGVAVAVLAAKSLGLGSSLGAGGYCGALTTTPALASVMELAKKWGGDPVVGYSIAYPFGVLGVIAACAIYSRRTGGRTEPAKKNPPPPLVSRTVQVTKTEIADKKLHEVRTAHGLDVTFGRYARDGEIHMANAEVALQIGDSMTIVGTAEEVERAMAVLGEPAEVHLADDRSHVDFRRILVSNRDYIGKPLRELRLPTTLGATVTRLRRGDVDIVPHADTVLQAGDRVRVVADAHRLDAIAKTLGDSYEAVSEIDVVSLSLGVAAGLLLGLVQIPLPGGLSFSLGLAGGPLMVALVLGAVHRTGPVVWEVPYSANLTLRQVGLVLFFAGVGTRSGFGFVQTLGKPSGWVLLGAFALVTLVTSTVSLLLAHRLFKGSPAQTMGMVAAVHTQPAVLSFVRESTGDDQAELGYATVFPLASVLKIVLAQVVFLFLH